MRARKVVTRSGKRFRGKFPSRKLKRMVHWESLLERDAIFHFECHPLVATYQEQPSIEKYYDILGKQHSYFPDFRVDFLNDSNLLVEVKYERDLKKKKVAAKLQAVAKRFEEQGRRFRVMTEEDIRRQPLLSNLKAIFRSGQRWALHASDADTARTLTGGPTWALGNLVDQLGGVHRVLRLVGSNHLRLNVEAPFSDDSVVSLVNNRGGAHGTFCL